MIEFLKLPKISFDEKTHTYSLDGGEKLGKESISRISKIADGDNFGVASGWAAREVSAEILNLFKADTSYTKEEIELMAKDAKSAPRKKRDSDKRIYRRTNRTSWVRIKGFIQASIWWIPNTWHNRFGL